ncbi:MAG: flippase-like domain-containing protein, partial [Syntrophales bacterium LBB04]|nr:flippase-like domain-containing protein [Syntrophales bacterium LBB04]
WKLFEIGVVSTTLNNILGFLGAAGHSLRVELIKRRGIDAGEVLAASIFHSYLNNVMLLLLLALGLISLLISRTVYGGSAIGLGLIAAILVVSLIGSTVIIFVPKLKSRLLHLTKTVWYFFTHRDITSFLTDFDHALTHGLVALKGRPWNLTLLLVLMTGEWSFEAVALWFCFGALGNAPNLGVLLSGFGIGLSAGNLSFVPGGLGVQEASMAGIYALLGMSFAQAALVAILFRVVFDFVPFFISLPLYAQLIRKA